MGYGVKIKKLLKEKNTSIKELSTRTGISLNTLYSITKRDSEKVDPGILLKIASCLDIDITELVDSDSTHFIDYMDIINEYDYKQNINKKNFSNNLNYLIGYYRIDLTTLAKDLNIDKETIQKWVSGEVFPKYHEQRLLEKYFNLDEYAMVNQVILGVFANKPDNDEIDNVLLNSYERMGLSKDELENFKKFLNYMNNTRPNSDIVISKFNKADKE